MQLPSEGHGQDLTAWFDTPPGRYLLAWEQARFDEAVDNLFGYNALQLGLPVLDALAANRMPHRWLALPEPSVDPAGSRHPLLVTHAAALPFPAASLDLVVLPHTLEFSADPHAVLREVERVLVPEGRVVIAGMNPASLWGLRQRQAHCVRRLGGSGAAAGQLFLPETGDFIGHWRLRDWLRLLSFEVDTLRFGCYRPAVRSERWLQRYAWVDRLGQRWWPILGAVYFLVAVKRVRGMHLLGPAWKPRRAAGAAVAVTQKPALRQPPAEPRP
jgi:SAM-dependent methyltransferase